MIRPAVLLALLLSVGFPAISVAQGKRVCVKKPPATAESNPDTYFENFPYKKQLLNAKDQEALKQEYGEFDGGTAEYARAIIFGRHGRVFVDPEIKQLLSTMKWYKPNPKFSNAMLNDSERKNLDIVRGIEAKLHVDPKPGDMRWWRDKYVLKDQLVDDSLVQLHVMRAEIEAVHGKKFPDEPLIQKYFNERYWYKPSAHYDPKSLNEHETANLKELAKAEAKKTGKTLSPGSLLAFGEKPIKPEMLKGDNLYDLRLLRNEIYAIRGATFRTQWLQDHFSAEDWYTPLPDGVKATLTPLDQRNIAVILKKENEIHESLSTTKIKPTVLTGMLSDDAGRLRDEIYARRGKVFKDKWLQSYFVSMPWYKPNRGYSDKLLTSIERANIKTISRYRDTAKADEESMSEG
jgi:hypothetical protein